MSQCLDCPAGKYCDRLNAVEYTAECDGGYYCGSGVDRKDPLYSNGSVSVSNCTRGVHTGVC